MTLQAEGEGFEPTMKLSPHTCFQDRRLKPLGHPSAVWRVEFYHSLLSVFNHRLEDLINVMKR
jgi:hypothetical protein